ncbi:ankyrin repeat and SOCS box protein 12-like [Mizuhopecten yessoensis]|uniref:Ankyrin repeat and SOCS box protein 12 n=1 Tax=Mizuhopecten yessoensis TaxID=6573 RepID=A0A210PRJ2_MIZYE|nr:ankyrin repeat and SOCS box protein 12-like [Mizuhopecten yessoensis]OWF39074.1 Ankyrin repeat and SOCS box protein 12 [Mizuhopecten yessoensis]
MIPAAIAAVFRDCVGTDDKDEHHGYQLQQFIRSGDIDNFKDSLKYPEFRAVINMKNHLGCTPLRIAAAEGQLECVRYLLDLGALVDSPDVKLQTPLLVAMKNFHFDCAELLLERGASPNGDPHHITTPIYIMTMEGSFRGMKLLLEHGADTYESHNHILPMMSLHVPVCPVQVALTYKRYNCLRLLLSYGAETNYFHFYSHIEEQKHMMLYDICISKSCVLVGFQLLYESGTNIYIRPKESKQVWEMEERPHIQSYLKYITENPRSLKSSCRLSLMHQYGRSLLSQLDKMDIPTVLKTYLSLADIPDS